MDGDGQYLVSLYAYVMLRICAVATPMASTGATWAVATLNGKPKRAQNPSAAAVVAPHRMIPAQPTAAWPRTRSAERHKMVAT